ncbi:ABC transporter ATP-binding protein [Herbaspirillum sp. GCM10030257]|uniref:ABC transporter permease subunit n=1 Tax=Herbaspirillum sp. GCM10030257 TaxID=3273393 RepID=UPI00361B01BD
MPDFSARKKLTTNAVAYLAPIGLMLFLILFPFVAAPFGNSWVRIADMALLYIMLALGLNIVVGYAGLLDLGYIAFYAVGAYTTALLASPQFAIVLESVINTYPALGHAMLDLLGPGIALHGIHLSVWAIVPLNAALAAFFGVLLGAPTLKLHGDYLAVVTLGFGEILRLFIINLNAPVNITDGPKGINMIDPIRVFGVSLAGEPGSRATLDILGYAMPSVNAYYFLFLTLCAVIVVVSVRLAQSRMGRAFIAIREDEVAASAMGIHTRNVKLLAFALGASFGGVSGAMFAVFQGYVSPESFTLNESIAVLSMVVLGGMGHVPGVVMGSVTLAVLPEVLRQLLLGLAMVLIMLVRPAGLWPSRQRQGPAMSRASVSEGVARSDVDRDPLAA